MQPAMQPAIKNPKTMSDFSPAASASQKGQGARVQVCALGNVGPSYGRDSEPREAVVNPTRYFIGTAGVGEYLTSDLLK